MTGDMTVSIILGALLIFIPIVAAIVFGTMPLLRYIAAKTDKRQMETGPIIDRHGKIVGAEHREL